MMIPRHEEGCAKCGHTPAAHTNYANGIPTPCWARKGGDFCHCPAFVRSAQPRLATEFSRGVK